KSDSALRCINDTAELCQDTISRGVDDASAILADQGQQDRLMCFEIAYRARIIGAHEGAVAGDVRGQDRRQAAVGNLSIVAVLRHPRSPWSSWSTRLARPSSAMQLSRARLVGGSVCFRRERVPAPHMREA